MSNIVGEGFPKEIIEQVKVRQSIYGSINRTNEQLSYLETKTGWCKLVSSVYVEEFIDESRTIKNNIRNIPYIGDELASKFMLFGGSSINSLEYTYAQNLNLTQRGGIWPGTGNSNDFAYGIGGTSFGLTPMPGITSANIKTETRGSLKTATINIKANNRDQFDIIDILYLRLGYSMLLEWGSSSYFKNNGEYISDNFNSLSTRFLKGLINYDNYVDEIKRYVIQSNGNYDALIGKVVNFNWTFDKDGTYNITLVLRSMGDVIESLKTNILLPDKKENKNEETSANASPEDVIKSFSKKHEVGKEFYRIQQLLQKQTEDRGTGITKLYLNNKIEAFKQRYQEGNIQYYIRLGYFLQFVEKKILPFISYNNSDPSNNTTQITKIDTDIESNIIYLMARQISTRPDICVINQSYYDNSLAPSIIYSYAPGTEDFITNVNGNTYGKIMNSYFNMKYILTQMESIKTSEGKVLLYDLLSCLTKGWNEATGNFNKLEPTVDENTIKFIDEVVLPDKDEFLKKQNKSTDLVVFDVYGYYYEKNEKSEIQSSHAGFIKELSFNTTISPNMASMITVGATSNGYIVGQDSTALSRMNKGLVDRFKKNIKSHNTPSNVGQNAIIENYRKALSNFLFFNRSLSYYNNHLPSWNQEAIDDFTNTATTLYEYDQAQQSISASKASPNGGFLPFDLQVTIDGLSGMKVYQKYTIDTSYLPSNYPETLEFLIKGITNNIQNNEWTTTLESIAVPKNPFGSTIGKGPVSAASQPAGTQRDESRDNRNADILRGTLTSLGYREKGNEISSGGDINVQLVQYASAVFKELKKQLPEIIITVTGGNDSYHQSLNYLSSHKLGTGLDFTISPQISNTAQNRQRIDEILGGFAAGNRDKMVSFINEYDFPSSAATAGHYHLRIGKIENKRIYDYYKLADQKLLQTYQII